MEGRFRYQSIARHLRERITSRMYAVGERIPGVRALGKEFGVTAQTVARALKELEARSLVECRPKRGVFVRPRTDWDEGAVEDGRGSRLIGFIAFDTLVSPYWSGVVSSFEARLTEDSYHMVLGNSMHDADRAISYVRSLSAKGIDGLVYVPFDGVDEESYTVENRRVMREIETAGVPFVTLDRSVPGVSACRVGIDNYQYGLTLAGRLQSTGAVNPLCISVGYSSSIAERERAYVERFGPAARLATIPTSRVTEEHLGLIAEIVADANPDGLFLVNSSVLNGYLRARDAGLMESTRQVPVVAFEDFPVRGAQAVDSRCLQGIEPMARAAAELILTRVDRRDHTLWGSADISVRLPCRIIVGEGVEA